MKYDFDFLDKKSIFFIGTKIAVKAFSGIDLVNTKYYHLSLGMSRYYKYFRYQLPWVIDTVRPVSLKKKLVTRYLYLLRSVNTPVLVEYMDPKDELPLHC